MLTKMYKRTVSFPFLIIGIVLCLSICSSAQIKSADHGRWNWKHHKAEAIDRAKKYLVSDIEPSLPRQQFARWFRALMGKDAKLAWRITDCGWELSADGNRDQTMCVVVDAALGSDFGTSVYLQVGTFTDRIMADKPVVRIARVSREDEPSESTTKLSELSNVIDAMMSK